MTTEEGNKLIAEFETDEPEVLARDLLKAGTLESMCYHNQWDWLMSAVEKIESIYDKHHGHFGVHIVGNCCSIEGTYLHRSMGFIDDYGYVYNRCTYDSTKIGATWLAVVYFIEWYNLKLKK